MERNSTIPIGRPRHGCGIVARTLTSSATELTTAATDAALALACLAILAWWLRRPSMLRARKPVWASVFALLTVGSALGAAAHGFDWSDATRAALWRPLYLSLGWSVAMFVVGALGDWRGAGAARAAVPWAIAAGLGLFVVTQLSDDFTLFIAYEGVAMAATLLIYLHLAVGPGMPGAGRVAAGVALTLVAAIVQASSLRLELVWTFDHNSLFHLVQIPALATIANGLGAGAGLERRSRL